MLSIARDQDVDTRVEYSSEDHIVGRIAGNRLNSLRPLTVNGADTFEQSACRSRTTCAEAEFVHQDSLQLFEDVQGQHKLDPPVDCLFEQAARRPLCDEGRDEYVGIAGDAQVQRRSSRCSSTSASTSSGPIPRSSACRRP